MDDGRIVDLFLARNEDAIAAVGDKYGASLHSLAKRILASDHDAEECVNDAYFSAWRLIPPNEPRGYLFAFLAKLVRCAAVNRYNRERRQKRCAAVCELTQELEECIPSPDDVESRISDEEFGRCIDAFLGSLDAQTRYMFLRRYWYCEPLTVIAESIGASESRVRSALFRVRKKLKEYLKKEGIDL